MDNVKEETQKKSNNKSLKKVAAISLMFTLGTSAFAGDGKLFTKNANYYDIQAVNDIVAVVNYQQECLKDGSFSQEEKQKIASMQTDYDKNYGEGAFKYVYVEMNEYSKTPAFIANAIELGEEKSKTALAHHAVRNAARQQEIMARMDYKLSDYEYGR